MSLQLIVGVAALVALLLYFAFNLSEEHTIFKVFIFFSCFTLMLLIPTATMDNSCSTQVNQTTVIGNVTSHTYGTVCQVESTNGTNKTFYRLFLWIYRVFWLYVGVFFFWWVYEKYFRRIIRE